MANPLDAFKGLKKWQQGAVAVGGIAVVGGFVLYERKQKAAGASAATPAAPAVVSASVAGMVTDPATGQSYPIDDTDPLTGLTYGTEIQEYGSVGAADEQATANGAAAGQEGLDQTQYDEETGQAAGGTSASNEQWVAEVESALSQLGYSDTDIQQGLARYFSSSPQGTAADGTDLYSMMDTAVGEFGPPPSGTYALIKGGTGTGAGSASVTVPDEVGQADLATAEAAITAAGLVPLPAGDSATGSKGKVTAQEPAAGSSVSKGSSVTLTYTVAAAAATIHVPDLVGNTTAGAVSTLFAENLTPAGTTGVPATNIVTATSPKAGTAVKPKSTVTITSKAASKAAPKAKK